MPCEAIGTWLAEHCIFALKPCLQHFCRVGKTGLFAHQVNGNVQARCAGKSFTHPTLASGLFYEI